jgi:CRISPR/Cas system endoribonuclease Cas6 (RAMP superfamily)
MKSFYDFNRNNPEERLEQYKLFPELALFHIALREEMSEEEYQAFYQAEKEANKRFAPLFHQDRRKWATV